MTVLSDIFDIRRGHPILFAHSELAVAPEGVNFVSASGRNNGVTGRIYPPKSLSLGAKGDISVATDGSVLSAFVQDEPFVAQNVVILSPKGRDMGLAEKLWWCSVIRSNQYRYSYGRKANKTLSQLAVPDECPAHIIAMRDELPEAFAETFDFNIETVNALPARNRWAGLGLDERFEEARPLASPSSLPPTAEWQEFALTDLFSVERGGSLRLTTQAEGTTPYVSSSHSNNGVTGYTEAPANHSGGVLTFSRNGAPGFATYQDRAAYVNDDVFVLTPCSPMSSPVALFMVGLLSLEQTKYGYGRKPTQGKVNAIDVRLPVGSDSAPDWASIEAYMNGLPWSAAAI